MSKQSTWVRPGTWTALSGEGIWVLAETGNDAALLSDLWQAVSQGGADTDAVLTRLMSQGFANLRGFAIASARGDSVRLVARHPASATLTSGGSSQGITPSASITWTDVSHDIPERLVLSSGANADTALEFPLALGATAASSLRIDFADLAPVGREITPVDAEPASLAPPVEESLPSVEESFPQVQESVEATEEAENPDEPVAVNPYLNLLTDSTSERDALIERLNAGDAEPEEEPEAVEPLASHATAAWRDEPQAEPESVPEAPAAPDLGPGSLIDGVPGMSTPIAPVFTAPAVPTFAPFAASSVGPETDEPATPETDERTLNRAKLRDLLDESVNAGPTVMAVRCLQGHLSNPVLPNCRVCGTPIPEQTPQEVPRPSLGQITMPNGDSIPLDKNVVLGRAPEAIEGGDQHLVTVNITGEISRKHALITLDGWNVLLRDLNTTNGTYLTLPGQSIVQLRSGEDYLIEPGAEIDLADVLTLRFQVLG